MPTPVQGMSRLPWDPPSRSSRVQPRPPPQPKPTPCASRSCGPSQHARRRPNCPHLRPRRRRGLRGARRPGCCSNRRGRCGGSRGQGSSARRAPRWVAGFVCARCVRVLLNLVGLDTGHEGGACWEVLGMLGVVRGCRIWVLVSESSGAWLVIRGGLVWGLLKSLRSAFCCKREPPSWLACALSAPCMRHA